jgi:hypothetical protein
MPQIFGEANHWLQCKGNKTASMQRPLTVILVELKENHSTRTAGQMNALTGLANTCGSVML